MSGKLWWELFPDRLGYELAALDAAKISYQRDEQAFAEGILRLQLQFTLDGDTVELYAIFPDLYPYFRFELEAPNLYLPHHQNPFQKNLCLLGRSTELWNTSDCLAKFITERLPLTIKAGLSDTVDEVTTLEQHQAEPYADYYSYQFGTAIIVSSDWKIDDHITSGTLILGLNKSLSNPLHAAVLEIHDEEANTIAQANDRLANTYAKGRVAVRWVRLAQPPEQNSPEFIFNHCRSLDQFPSKTESYPTNEGRLQICAALFPEEIRNWRQLEDGWLFSCRIEHPDSWEIWKKDQRTRHRPKRRKRSR
ncbi:MAG: hypothetical protein IT445_06255 [Phycisphaeraceae bacterium]|nr:hypothetical protein [Phycisphaeraceae bacterium]